MRLIPVLLSMIACTFSAVAQEGDLSQPIGTEFNESFDSTVNVSGTPLVGLIWGGQKKQPMSNAIGLSAVSLQDSIICLRVRTQDGRFHALNPYQVITGNAATTARLGPITKNFKRELSQYRQRELAILAFESEHRNSCYGRPLNIKPVILNDEPILTVQVNTSSRRADATLLRLDSNDDLQVFAKTRCEKSDTRTPISFDRQCVFTEFEEHGAHAFEMNQSVALSAILRITLKDDFGDATEYDFPISLSLNDIRGMKHD